MIRQRSSAPVWLAAMLAAAALAVACGGVDSGGTGLTNSASTGPISGFGSVIVNAVRYDDSQAAIVDDDGVAHTSDDLKLGMVVQIDAGPLSADTGGTHAVAKKIQFGSDMAGPVQSIDTATSTMVVLGQKVQVTTDTVFDGVDNALASVKVGDLLQVYGIYDPQQSRYTATRVEAEAGLPFYRLRGFVRDLDTMAHTFVIGGATIHYGTLTPPDAAALANGVWVRVALATTQQAARWEATVVHVSGRALPDGTETELDGYITDFASLADFKVQGVPVDASGPDVEFSKGSKNQLANGLRIEVEGRMVGGHLVAREVEIRKPGGGDQQFELHGRVDWVNTINQTFFVRGVVVSYDANTAFTGGPVAKLVVGAQVEVRGTAAANGLSIRASSVKFGP